MKFSGFLMLGIMLAVMTIGMVAATDQNDTAADLTDSPDQLTDESCNETSSNLDNGIEKESLELTNDFPIVNGTENPLEYGHEELMGDASFDNRYYLFRGDCWTVNNNFESSAAVTSETLTDLTATGTFRTENDLVGLYWNSNDLIQHPYISYGNRSNYCDVILEFDYEMSGCRDFSNDAVNIIIASNGGEMYFLTMNRFIDNRHVTLDFNNLTLLPGNSYIDKNGHSVTVGEETRLNVSDLKYVMLELMPEDFVENNVQYTITDNVNYTCRIFNITVTNGEISNEQPPLETHQYRLCEGYDDIYNLNPLRISKEMRKLGYVEWVDLYIGASYFYEKSGRIGDTITDLNFNHNRTEKMVLDKNVPLNAAFRAWLDCYARELKNNGVSNLVISVSMENLQCPQSWRQMDVHGNFAMSGWTPSTFICSPCHEEVIPYLKMVCEACLDIVVENGLQPILQMGETWWWWNENNWSCQSPCFYDNSTKAKYLEEHGTALPEYEDAWFSEYDESAINWLNQQLVQYSDALRQVVKGDRYADGVYMALFFTPSVLDEDRVPPMMRDANYLRDAYSPFKLDVLQIEDYDWVIFESPYHTQAYEIGQELGFDESRLHYFGGFVQYREDANRYWGLIKDAMDEAMDSKFKEVFVWAGLQVRRDNKILGYDESELLNNLTLTTVTSPDFVSVDENFTIELHTQEWISGNLNVYDYANGRVGEFLVSGTITDGYSSVRLSSNNVGLNKFYLEFDYSGGEYHLIENVYVIENSENVIVDLSSEIEEGSDLNIVVNALKTRLACVYISVDGCKPGCYPVENGEFSIAVKDLSIGYHAISVKYDDGNPVGDRYSNTFTVNVGVKTGIECGDVVTYYGSGENLIVMLKDTKNNTLKGMEISIILDGSNHTLTTDDNGQAALSIDLPVGNYSAKILFSGCEGYLSSSECAEIIINKIATMIIASDIITVYNVDKDLLITLMDEANNAVNGGNVVINLNGEEYNESTDANGQVRVSVGLPVGEYTANITFVGGDIYKSSNLTSKVTVKKATSKLIASSVKFKAKKKSKKVTVTLKNNLNKAIKKVAVKLKVNKKTYRAKTNSMGVATFKVKLTKKGKYKAVYTFKGDSNYESSTKKVKIIVK